MLIAAAQVVAHAGYGGMSVARITSRAGVSRRTFYDHFEDREDCFLALFEDAVARAGTLAGHACAATGESRWRERVRSGLSALLLFLDDEPGLGSLLVVEVLGAGPKVLDGRARSLDTLIAIVDHGRDEATDPKSSSGAPLPLTAEGVVGAVLAVIHARILDSHRSRLIDLLNPLMGMIVLPYLGPHAAAQELTHTTPPTTPKPRQTTRAPLQGLGMRLTNRTLRVLAVIQEHPGSSNRQLAQASGITDQGQISKLLARLQHLRLIQNTNQHAKGEPNSWTLTSKGNRLQTAIRPRSETAER